MQDILTNVLTSEDIEAEMRRLQSELAEDTKELIRIRTEYHQAEQCLQNWQGRFALAEVSISQPSPRKRPPLLYGSYRIGGHG